jgi:hypothetical protein
MTNDLWLWVDIHFIQKYLGIYLSTNKLYMIQKFNNVAYLVKDLSMHAKLKPVFVNICEL